MASVIAQTSVQCCGIYQFSRNVLGDVDIDHPIAFFVNPGIVVFATVSLVQVSMGKAISRLETYYPSVMCFQLLGDRMRVSGDLGANKRQTVKLCWMSRDTYGSWNMTTRTFFACQLGLGSL